VANVNANVNVTIQTQQAAAQLRKLSAEISKFNQQSFATNSAAAQHQRSLNQALVDGVRTSGHFRTSIVPMTSAVENFSRSIEKGQLSLGQYTRYAASQLPGMRKIFTREFDMINRVAERRVKLINTQFVNLGESAGGMQRALALTPKGLDQFASKSAIALQKQQIFNRLLRDGSTQLLNWGKNTQWAGRQLMVGFSIPLAMLGAQAAKVFRDLEKEAINFRKVYGDTLTTPMETEQALDNVKELSKEFTKYGVQAQKTMQLAAVAAQAGKEGAELMAATTQATRLAVLGNMENEEAMRSTIALQSAFKMSNEELADSINFLNMVNNRTVLSLADVAESIPRVAPVIQGLGSNVRELSVMLVAMREGGVSAAEAANGLKSSLGRLITPSRQAKDMASSFGIDLDQIVRKNAGDLLGTIMELANAMKSLGDLETQQLLSTLFGKFQFARIGALFENITREGSQAQKALEMMGMSAAEAAAVAEKELSAIEDSVATKFTAAMEKAKLALAPVGEEFLRALTPVVEVIGNFLSKFSEMPSGIKTGIVAATALIGGLAPILLMVVGLLANAAANTGKFILFLRKQIGVLRGNGEQFKMYAESELLAAAAAASLEGKTNSLTSSMLLQKPAIESLIALYGRLAASARTAAAAMPAMMGGVGLMGGATRAAGGFSAVAPKLPIAYRNQGGPIFESESGKTIVPGTGNRDTVPAMLTPGEFVINKKATQKNLPLIKAINSGSIDIGSPSSPIPATSQAVQHAFLGLLIKRSMLKGKLVGAHASVQQALSRSKALPLLAGAERALVSANPKARVVGLDRSMLNIDDAYNQAMKSGAKGVQSKSFAKYLNKQNNLFAKMPEIASLSPRTQQIFKSEIVKRIGGIDGPVDDALFAKAYGQAVNATKSKLSPKEARAFSEAIKKTQQLSQTRVVFDLPDGVGPAGTYASVAEANKALRASGKTSAVKAGEPFYYINGRTRKLSALVLNPDTGRIVSVTTDSTRKIAKSRLPQARNSGGKILGFNQGGMIPGVQYFNALMAQRVVQQRRASQSENVFWHRGNLEGMTSSGQLPVTKAMNRHTMGPATYADTRVDQVAKWGKQGDVLYKITTKKPMLDMGQNFFESSAMQQAIFPRWADNLKKEMGINISKYLPFKSSGIKEKARKILKKNPDFTIAEVQAHVAAELAETIAMRSGIARFSKDGIALEAQIHKQFRKAVVDSGYAGGNIGSISAIYDLPSANVQRMQAGPMLPPRLKDGGKVPEIQYFNTGGEVKTVRRKLGRDEVLGAMTSIRNSQNDPYTRMRLIREPQKDPKTLKDYAVPAQREYVLEITTYPKPPEIPKAALPNRDGEIIEDIHHHQRGTYRKLKDPGPTGIPSLDRFREVGVVAYRREQDLPDPLKDSEGRTIHREEFERRQSFRDARKDVSSAQMREKMKAAENKRRKEYIENQAIPAFGLEAATKKVAPYSRGLPEIIPGTPVESILRAGVQNVSLDSPQSTRIGPIKTYFQMQDDYLAGNLMQIPVPDLRTTEEKAEYIPIKPGQTVYFRNGESYTNTSNRVVSARNPSYRPFNKNAKMFVKKDPSSPAGYTFYHGQDPNKYSVPGKAQKRSKHWTDGSNPLMQATMFGQSLTRQQSKSLSFDNVGAGPFTQRNMGGIIPQSFAMGGNVLFANNGTTVPGMGNRDTVPAMLTPGEFVVNKEATQNNLPLLHAINDGSVQHLSTGGDVVRGKTFADQIRMLEKRNPQAARRLIMARAEALYASEAARRVPGATLPVQADRGHVIPHGGGSTKSKAFLINPFDREAARRNPSAAWFPQSHPENQASRIFAGDKAFQQSLRSALNETVVKSQHINAKDAKKIMTKIERGTMLTYMETRLVTEAMRTQAMQADIRRMSPEARLLIKQFEAASDARRDFRRGATPEARAARELARSGVVAPGGKPPLRETSSIAARKLAVEEARRARAEGRGARIGGQTGARFTSEAEKRAIQRSVRRNQQKVERDETRRQRENDRRAARGRAGAGGRGGDGSQTAARAAGGDGPDKPLTRYQRISAGIGKIGMGAGMGVSMASMMPMLGADEEGKWMGMNSMTAMMGLMGAGTLLSILPMMGKAAIPVAGIAAAAAAVGFGFYKWRDSIDSAARQTAEIGSNLGVAANSVGNMASILGKQNILDARKYQQLAVIPEEQEEFALYTQMLTQEGSAGEKLIKELKPATSEQRFAKLTDYLRGAIAAELLTLQEAKLFSKAVGAQVGDPLLGIRAGASVSGQRAGSSALMEIAQERIDAALAQPEIRKVMDSTDKKSLDASEASMMVGAGTQIVKSFNEAIAKAQTEYESGAISFSELINIVDSANSSIQTWEGGIKTAYENVNDFGGILQGTKTALALAGVSEEQQNALNDAYKEVYQGIGSVVTAGAQRVFSTAEDEILPQVQTEGAFLKLAELAAKSEGEFEKTIQGVQAYIKSEFFDREAFDNIVEYGKNLKGLMDSDMLKAATNLAVAERGMDPLDAVSMMNTIAQNETALQAFIDGGQTVEAFMNAIVAANAELMFSSDELQRSFKSLSGQLDKTGQSEALSAYLAGAQNEEEREARLREIQRVGAGRSARSALNAQSAYLATRTIAGQYYDPATVDAIQQSAAYQSAMTRTRMETRTVGRPEAGETIRAREFDESLVRRINEAIGRAGQSEVSDNVVQYALNLSVQEGTDAAATIDRFTNKVKDLQGLDDEIRIALNIDLNVGEDVNTFGGYAEDIERSWDILSALNPNIDMRLVARAAILDEDGNVIDDPGQVARNVQEINKAFADLEKAGGSEQKRKAQIELVQQYMTKTEVIGEDGTVTAIDPADIVAEANRTLSEIGKSLDNLPAVQASRILQIQTSLSDATAQARAEVYKMLEDEKNALEAKDFETARRIAQRISTKTKEMESLEKSAQASILREGLSAGSTPSGGSRGGGGGQSPLQSFVQGILDQFKMWVKASATLKDINNLKGKFVDMVLKSDGIFDKLNKVKGIDPLRLQEILGMGPEGANEFLKKYVKSGKLTKAGKSILDAAAAAGINETIGTAGIQVAQAMSQTRAAGILDRRGASGALIQEIAGDPKKSAELVRLQQEYNKSLKSGNDKEIAKANRALNKFIKSQRESLQAEKDREEAFKSAAQKAIEANDKMIEQNNKEIEKGDYSFEKQEKEIIRRYRERVTSSEDQIKSLNKQIREVSKLIEAQEELNQKDQDRIRDLERQKEMLSRQLDELERANELDQRRIDTLQREDEIRSRVADALIRELDLMDREEEKIRKSYEKRFEALEKVAKVNDYIVDQQRQQLGLSQAIAEGDIYAATAAAQEMRASSAQFAVESARSGLEKSMENQIKNLRTSEGLTREEAEKRIQEIQDQSYQTSLQIRDIQDAIYQRNLQMIPLKDQIRNYDMQIRDLQDQIYDRETTILQIQRDRLDPLQKALSDQQGTLDNLNEQIDLEIEALRYLGMTSAEWDEHKDLLMDQNRSLSLLNDLLAEEEERVVGISKHLNRVAKQMVEINKIAAKRSTEAVKEKAAELAAIEKRDISQDEKNKERSRIIKERQDELRRIEQERASKTEQLTKGLPGLYAGGFIGFAAGGSVRSFISNEPPPVQKRGMGGKIKGYGRGGKMLRYPMGGLIPYSFGGSVSGDGSRDSVFAKLTPGEFVIRKSMVNKYGIPMLESLNQGSFFIPKYDMGGNVSTNIKPSSSTANINAPVYNSYDMKFAITGTNASADEIANKVMFKMKQVQNQGIRNNRGY